MGLAWVDTVAVVLGLSLSWFREMLLGLEVKEEGLGRERVGDARGDLGVFPFFFLLEYFNFFFCAFPRIAAGGSAAGGRAAGW